jgi:hypothetical protein
MRSKEPELTRYSVFVATLSSSLTAFSTEILFSPHTDSPGTRLAVARRSSLPPRATKTPLWRWGSTTTFLPPFAPLAPPLAPPRPPRGLRTHISQAAQLSSEQEGDIRSPATTRRAATPAASRTATSAKTYNIPVSNYFLLHRVGATEVVGARQNGRSEASSPSHSETRYTGSKASDQALDKNNVHHDLPPPRPPLAPPRPPRSPPRWKLPPLLPPPLPPRSKPIITGCAFEADMFFLTSIVVGN